MPSKTNEGSADRYSQSKMEELTALSEQVNECVAEGQWEQLVTTLNLRRECLEALFSEDGVESDILKSLADSILEQDAVFITTIQKQQKLIEKQLQDLDKGQQAIQAYGS